LTRIEKSIEIKASPEKVYPMLFWDGCMKWFAPFKKVDYTSKIKNKTGTTVHVIAEAGGLKAEFDGENTETIENEKVAWRTTSGNFTGFGFNAVSPTKSGTKVTMMFDYELPYSLLGKIIDKLRFQKALEKSIETSLNKLKDMMEK